MANFDTIKTTIDANINTNGNQAITGAVMNSVLKQMVDSTDAELTELESRVGNAESSWEGSTSTGHSSSVDGVALSIKKGEYFIVETKCSVESPAQIFAKYVGDLSEMLVATNLNKQHTFVAKENIEYIGVYHPALESAVLVSLSVKSALSFTTTKNAEEIYWLDNDLKKTSLNIGKKYEVEVPSASIQLSFNISLKKDEKYVLKLKAENVITKDAAVVSPLYGNSTASGNEISVHFVDGAEVVYTPKTDIDKLIFAVTNGAFISSGNITIQAYNYNSIAKDVASLSSGLEFTNKVYESSWEGSASGGHSSNSDGIVCFIPENSSFIIETKCLVNSSAQVFVKYVGDENTTKILDTSFNKKNEFKATRAIEYVGVYHPALTSTSNVTLLVTESKKYKIDELPYFTSNEIKSNGTVRFETITIPKGEKYTLKFDANGISKTEVSGLYYNKMDDEHFVGNVVNGSIISFEPNEDVNSFIIYVRNVSFISKCTAIILVCKTATFYEYILKGEGALKDDIKDNSFISAYCDVDIETKTREFAQLFNNATSEVEPFVYFTDPHVFFPDAYPKLKESIALLQKCYNSIAANFVLCGGDWLTNHNQKDALYYLSYTDGMMNKMFDRYYPMLGNHDNNYQGTTDESEQIGSGIINNQSMINLWFRKYGKMFYSFKGTSTKFFVLDTGIDWTPDMDAYRWEQIEWLGDALKNTDMVHNAIAMHIFWNDGVTPMANNVTLLANAFNSKTSVTLNGKVYDFANTKGKVHFIITGHVHSDRIEIINNVPIYCTTQFKQNYTGQTTFDLVLIDYGSNKLKSVRIGVGENREMNLA